MRPIPFELPLKASEAASLADALFDQVEGRGLTDDLRNRFGSRAGAVARSSFTVFPGSLQKDPIHPSVYYVAVGQTAGQASEFGRTMLLRIAPAASPSSGLFPNAVLIGRMRTQAGHEIVVNAIPFTPSDRENIRTFVERVDHAFAPRPQGTLPAIEVINGTPASFEGFRTILKTTGVNMASLHSTSYETVLWSAVVSGWRDGYTAATTVGTGQPIEPGFTKYNAAASCARELYDAIQRAQAASGPRQRFDFEVSLADTPTLTTPDELAFHLQSLKAAGKPEQFIAPNIGLAGERLSPHFPQLAEVARSFNVTLSIQATGSEPPELLEQIGKATAGRINCKVPGDLAPGGIARLAGYLRV